MGLFDKLKSKSGILSHNVPAKSKASPVKADLTLAQLKQEQGIEAAPTLAQSQKAHTKISKDDTKGAYKILIKPLVTEKGSYFAASGKYLFEVYPTANKGQIKKAIEAVYGVHPIKVNIVRLPGKSVRYGKVFGTTKDQKKAIVTLRKGETIEVYEGV